MRNLLHAISCFCFLIMNVWLTGCASSPNSAGQYGALPEEKLVLGEGDSVRVVFPGASDLNTVQQIRRDGKITLPVLGEFHAAGLSPTEMEKGLLKAYGDQLVTKQVNVTMESGAFPVFVSGAVLRPGRITADRPMTALQAIMEAGGFDHARANTKKVQIIRQKDGKVRNMTVNLQEMLEGRDDTPFYLKASDIVFVPEKFSWF